MRLVKLDEMASEAGAIVGKAAGEISEILKAVGQEERASVVTKTEDKLGFEIVTVTDRGVWVFRIPDGLVGEGSGEFHLWEEVEALTVGVVSEEHLDGRRRTWSLRIKVPPFSAKAGELDQIRGLLTAWREHAGNR
jgi:hypothetical protein